MSPAKGHLLTALAALGRMAAANEIGMVTSTPDGVRDANDALLRLTGNTRADLEAGRVHWRVLTAPEWTSLDDTAVEELRETGSYGPHLKEYRRRDGTRLTVEVTGVLVSHEPRLIERRRQPLDTGFEQLARAVGELPAGDPRASCDRLLSEMTGRETVADDVVVACIDLNGPGQVH